MWEPTDVKCFLHVVFLQMQLPDRIIVYELSGDEPTDMRYRVKVSLPLKLGDMFRVKNDCHSYPS